MRQNNWCITSILLICFLTIIPFQILAQGVQEEQPEEEPLRVGILPDADSLPFMAAEQEGLYEHFNTPVELVDFQSPVERDAAFQAGRIDGFIGDTLAALFLESGGTDITVTSTTSGRYGIAATPGSGLSSLEDLKGKAIGVSTNTIIEYAVHALFSQQGIGEEAIKVTAIPKMPIRMELLLQGSIPAACLPEPLYALMLARGAVPVADTSQLNSAPGIMIFTAESVSQRKEDLQNLYRAYQRAADTIDADPDGYRDFLVEVAGFPEEVRNTYEFVTYGTARIPAEDEIQPVASWMQARDLIEEIPAYRDLVPQTWDLEFLD
ncbi:MAG: ABC transporter substrate-binding protein [Spirochaetota bacterium]